MSNVVGIDGNTPVAPPKAINWNELAAELALVRKLLDDMRAVFLHLKDLHGEADNDHAPSREAVHKLWAHFGWSQRAMALHLCKRMDEISRQKSE